MAAADSVIPAHPGALTDPYRIRVDKWLWAARFFKTRSLASKAVSGGHVHVNGERCKPARMLAAGDRLKIRRDQEQRTVLVVALSEVRGPARIAATLYEETPDSLARRQEEREQRRLHGATMLRTESRPDKHTRRRIRKLLQKD